MKTNDIESMEDFTKGYSYAKAQFIKLSKGKGWEEVESRPVRVGYGFRCKDCGAQIDGFVVSPRFCPYYGKEHG